MASNGLTLSKYSIGTGDRFARQAKAQLEACVQALRHGIEVIPVWNKSNREHTIIGSEPSSVRLAADTAVRALHWNKPYFCDADHITLQTVDRFLSSCDFYTIDVTDSIGQMATAGDVGNFIGRHPELSGRVPLEGVGEDFEISREQIAQAVQKFLAAVKNAGKVYRKIENAMGAGNFILEISWTRPIARRARQTC
jgi:tagaturonate epimerase